jgi:hypothetical protein
MIVPAQTIEEKVVLVAYLASKIGTTPQALVGQMPFEAGKVVRNGKPMGAVLYTNYRQHSIEFSAAGEPGWMTRATIRQMFSYPFEQLGVYTLLALIKRSNSTARTISRGLGFGELCVIPAGDFKADDIILYGMARDKCPWIAGRRGTSGRKHTHTHNGAAAIESSALTSNIGVP